MKKLILAAVAAAIMAPMFTSCTKGTCECYFVKYTIPAQPAQYDANGEVVREGRKAFDYTGYKWMSSTEVDACKEAYKKLNYENVEITKEDQYKTEADCISQEHILI